MITEKQAKYLDALRAGGTLPDVRARIGKSAPAVLVLLLANGLAEKSAHRLIGRKILNWYTLTPLGRTTWLSSLR